MDGKNQKIKSNNINMKSVIVKNLTEGFVKESFLNSIKPHVLCIRSQFHDFALKLKPELGKILIDHFNERLERANNTLMLGEYAPFILGDLFSVSKSTINKVAFPWFLMYEYSLLLDDLLDKEREYWQLELLSSQILLDNTFKEFIEVANNKFNIFTSFNKYRNESVDSLVNELKWSNDGFIENIDSAIIIQGRKAALVKFCISYMINIDKTRNISEVEETTLDNICAGIQLLDDLTDFIEDHNEGRTNVMLSSIFKWVEKNYPMINRDNINNEQLIAGLILSQSLNITLEFSHYLLKSVNKMICENKANLGSIEYFNDLAENCLQKGMQVDKILQIQSKNISIYKEQIFQINSNSLQSNSFEKESITDLFLDILSFTPKSSN